MKNKIFAVLVIVAMIFSFAPTSFASNERLSFETAYDDSTKHVTVTIYLENPIGLESTDLNVAFDPNMYEPLESYEQAELHSDIMCVAGIAATESGLVTCSVIFTKSCDKNMLNDGDRIKLVTFSFLPKVSDYDTEAFCYFSNSYDTVNGDEQKLVNVCGDPAYMEEHTGQVIAQTQNVIGTTAKISSNNSTAISAKWYVYLIAGVLAVGAIAGISMVAIKSSKNSDDENDENDEESKDESETNED